ncbi:MAG: hypothetical protein R2708_01165 [Vicinamibacterales bacterium]
MAFSPVLRQGGTLLASESIQRLVVDSGPAHGVELSVTAFPRRRLGVFASVEAARAALRGTNPDYQTSLRFVAAQPPDYVPTERLVGDLAHWPATSGHLRTWALAFGGVVRTAHGRRVAGAVRAGLALERWSGEVRSAAYTQFVLGGHATLFSVAHRVAMSPVEGQTLVRPHLGLDAHVTIAPRLALVGGLRITAGPERRIRVEAANVVDPGDTPFPPELEDVRHVIGQPELTLPGVRWRTVVGLRLLGR